jgi:hypothetical protein
LGLVQPTQTLASPSSRPNPNPLSRSRDSVSPSPSSPGRLRRPLVARSSDVAPPFDGAHTCPRRPEFGGLSRLPPTLLQTRVCGAHGDSPHAGVLGGLVAPCASPGWCWSACASVTPSLAAAGCYRGRLWTPWCSAPGTPLLLLLFFSSSSSPSISYWCFFPSWRCPPCRMLLCCAVSVP